MCHFLLAINCIGGRILYCLWDIAFDKSKITLFATHSMEEFPWDYLHKILHGSQRTAKVHSGEEILPKSSTPWVGCTNVADRQTTDRWICDSKDPNKMWSRSGKNKGNKTRCEHKEKHKETVWSGVVNVLEWSGSVCGIRMLQDVFEWSVDQDKNLIVPHACLQVSRS